MFNLESRHLLNLRVQNALDCISDNFNFKNFPGGACPLIPLECRAVSGPDVGYRTPMTLYYISRPPLSQNPPSAPVYVWLRLPGLFFFGLHWGPVETSNAKLGDFVYEDFPILLRIPGRKKKMTAHRHTLFLFFVFVVVVVFLFLLLFLFFSEGTSKRWKLDTEEIPTVRDRHFP